MAKVKDGEFEKFLNPKEARDSFLRSEIERVAIEMTKLEIDIGVLERTDPNRIIARKVLAKNSQGEPISTTEIKAEDMLKSDREKLEHFELRLLVLEQLLDNKN